MNLKQMLAAYQNRNRWIAYNNGTAVTARTEAAARRELKAGYVTERDQRWDDTCDTCLPLSREIAMMVCGMEPWNCATTLQGDHMDRLLPELTMQEVVILGRAIAAASKMLA